MEVYGLTTLGEISASPGMCLLRVWWNSLPGREREEGNRKDPPLLVKQIEYCLISEA